MGKVMSGETQLRGSCLPAVAHGAAVWFNIRYVQWGRRLAFRCPVLRGRRRL